MRPAFACFDSFFARWDLRSPQLWRSAQSRCLLFPAAEGDDDEAFARALQEQEAREFQARLLAMAGFAPGEGTLLPSSASLQPQAQKRMNHSRRAGEVPEAAGEDDDEDAELEGGVDVDAMSYEVRNLES